MLPDLSTAPCPSTTTWHFIIQSTLHVLAESQSTLKMSIIIFLIEKETFLMKYLILCKKHYVVISNSLDTGWRRIIYVTDTLLLHFHVLLASSNTHCENSGRRRYVRNYLYLSLEIFVIT